MTWSIVARSQSGAFGVAIASRFFAVGALCPHAHSGIGALATQALVNPLYGPRGLTMLSQGLSAADVVYALVHADGGREHRQVHVIDAEGHIAAHTGVECIEWCGQVAGDGFSVAGNMLAGPQVDRGHRAGLRRGQRTALRRTADRSDGSRRSRGRRQARQAGRGAAHLRGGGVSVSRPARRRSPRAADRAAAALREEPRALPALRRLPAVARPAVPV